MNTIKDKYLSDLRNMMRSKLFRHLDGIAMTPICHTLHTQGVTSFLLDRRTVTLDELCIEFDANSGYLNAGLDALCAQGWLDKSVGNTHQGITYSINNKSDCAFAHFYLYESANNVLEYFNQTTTPKMSLDLSADLKHLLDRYEESYSLEISPLRGDRFVQNQILSHVEGVIAGPVSVLFGMAGIFDTCLKKDCFSREIFGEYFEIFSRLGWFEKCGDSFQFSDKGRYFAKTASGYGVTTSYVPMLMHSAALMFGDPLILQSNGDYELHVNRAMNVWGSGGAHLSYFKRVAQIIIPIFNQPIEKQPKGIIDIGCGDGAFIKYLYHVIKTETLRGTMLDEHPIVMVGADYNKAALDITRNNLSKAQVPVTVLWGDIGRPDVLAHDLSQDYEINMSDLLNVRTFLDHNRMWQEPISVEDATTETTTGAFAYRGNLLQNNVVEASLVEHLKLWFPYVKKYGLIVIELHAVAPAIIAQNIGKTAATAYNLTHALSDQYIVDIATWDRTMRKVGLEPDPSVSMKFPNSELANISINHYVKSAA